MSISGPYRDLHQLVATDLLPESAKSHAACCNRKNTEQVTNELANRSMTRPAASIFRTPVERPRRTGQQQLLGHLVLIIHLQRSALRTAAAFPSVFRACVEYEVFS